MQSKVEWKEREQEEERELLDMMKKEKGDIYQHLNTRALARTLQAWTGPVIWRKNAQEEDHTGEPLQTNNFQKSPTNQTYVLKHPVCTKDG